MSDIDAYHPPGFMVRVFRQKCVYCCKDIELNEPMIEYDMEYYHEGHLEQWRKEHWNEP